MNTTSQIVCLLLLALATATARADRTLVHEGEIEAPVAEVWSAWTTSEGFASWAVAKAKIDMRLGGEMRTSYNPASTLDDEHTIINRILAYEPQRMLAIRNERAPAGFKNAELFQQAWSVIYFTPMSDERTHVRILGLGYGEGPAWDDIYNKFNVGNAYVLQKLKEKFSPPQGTEAKHDAKTDAQIDAHNVIVESNKLADKSESLVTDGARILARMKTLVGGEWIHESTRPDGSAFHVRNIYRHGPDGVSLVGQGWLADRQGDMHPHGSIQIYRMPKSTADSAESQPLRFFNIDEQGSVSQGDLTQISEDAIQWNWELHALNGRRASFQVLTRFIDDDHYRFTLSRKQADGSFDVMVDITFERVTAASER